MIYRNHLGGVDLPGCFVNWCRETVEMGVQPGNRPAVPRDWSRGIPERYVAGADTRGRQEGLPYPRSQQFIHETSWLNLPFVRDEA